MYTFGLIKYKFITLNFFKYKYVAKILSVPQIFDINKTSLVKLY